MLKSNLKANVALNKTMQHHLNSLYNLSDEYLGLITQIGEGIPQPSFPIWTCLEAFICTKFSSLKVCVIV